MLFLVFGRAFVCVVSVEGEIDAKLAKGRRFIELSSRRKILHLICARKRCDGVLTNQTVAFVAGLRVF